MIRCGGAAIEQDSGTAASVWLQAMDETSTGALLGPFELEDIDTSIALSRRFGIRQGGKIRCVDDFSKSGINSCCSTSKSPRPHTVDVISALCLSLAAIDTSGRPWVAQSFDLKQAYCQCAVHPESSIYAYIVAYDPTSKRHKAFKMRGLPSGSQFMHSSGCWRAFLPWLFRNLQCP